jgi:hypothetical protein
MRSDKSAVGAFLSVHLHEYLALRPKTQYTIRGDAAGEIVYSSSLDAAHAALAKFSLSFVVRRISNDWH